ncbi:MAG TPA: hypothetical protein VHN14_22885 [Kofleriaceae bacterium]|jgi:hypothetical protein|nr:hypothetical protein [Kofleriaceae bacterium]
MRFERMQALYNRCNPDEPLNPDDERYVDIDEHGVRGAQWSRKLARQIELSNVPVCQLFTGLRGTGKSTEIRRLAARLANPGKRNLLPVLIDADDVLDLTTDIDVSDVLALILLHSEREVRKAEGERSEAALSEGPLQRLWSWLTRTDVEISRLGIEGEVLGVKGKVELDLKTNPTVRQRVREVVAKHLSTFVRFVRDELLELDVRAKNTGRSGLVVMFDSLEKLRGTSLTWKQVLESAERVFANGAPYLQLPVHVLYTIPPALTRRMADPVSFLPMVKVRAANGALNEDGFRAISELVAKRISPADLEAMFGAEAVEARLRQIALWSGGYPREILRTLQGLLELDDFPIGEKTLERQLQRAGNTYRSIVYDSGAMAWLGTVARTKKLITANDAEREAADLFLTNNVILRYLNDDEWFDVHPSVAGMEELRAAPEAGPS